MAGTTPFTNGVDLKTALNSWCSSDPVGQTLPTKNGDKVTIDKWEFTGVTDLSNLLVDCAKTDGSSVAINCPSDGSVLGALTTCNPPIGDWKVGHVIKFSGMFNGNEAFDEDISGWNVGEVTPKTNRDFNNMFQGAKKFNQNLNKWKVKETDTVTNMFKDAIGFQQNVDNWWGYVKPADVCGTTVSTPQKCSFPKFSQKDELEKKMGKACEEVDASTYFDPTYGPIKDFMFTTTFTDMSGLVKGKKECNPDISNWNVGEVVNFMSMFEGAEKFNQDISGWNVEKGEGFASMFEGAVKFNQDLSVWQPTKGVNFDNMFKDANSFRQWLKKHNVQGESPNWQNRAWRSTGFCSGGAICTYRPFDRTALETQVKNFCDQYKDEPSTSIIVDDTYGELPDWNVETITDFSNLFYKEENCIADVSKWNVIDGEIFMSMFAHTNKFNSDISAWNIKKGNNFKEMFDLATAFNANITGWADDLKKDAEYDFMFYEAKSFMQDLKDWPDNAKNAPGFCTSSNCDPDKFPTSAPSVAPSQSPESSPTKAPTGSSDAFSANNSASIFALAALVITLFVR